MLLIGDVHGHLDRFAALLRDSSYPSIQLGDFGFRYQHQWHLASYDSSRHRVLFGNHDYYPGLDWPHSLGNFSSLPQYGIFAVRGADSIDRDRRYEGLNWWPEEELTCHQGPDALNAYADARPEIVLSHDCPHSVALAWFGIHPPSRTRQLLERMLEIHQPRLWIFGHHHHSRQEQRNGTTFRCLNELETLLL